MVDVLKSVCLLACLCNLRGASSWCFKRHLRFSCGNPARPQPGKNTVTWMTHVTGMTVMTRKTGVTVITVMLGIA